MRSEVIQEPWRAFLAAIDQAAPRPLALHCIGGFAVSACYGLDRPTGDIDIVEVRPAELKPWLANLAGRGSDLYRSHKIYLQIVTVASVPENYEQRLRPIGAGSFTRLQLFVLDPYDLALSKLTRNIEVDMEDVKHLARTQNLDLDVLADRYQQELRPVIVGPVERHDQTLALWIDAIREERGE
jgi:hypothetical protein